MSKAQLALDAINSLGSKTATAIARITREFGAHNTAAAAAALAAEGGGSLPSTDDQPVSVLALLPQSRTSQPTLAEIDHSRLLIQGWSAETDYSLPFVQTDVVILLKPTGTANLFAAEVNGSSTDVSEPDWDGDAPNVGDSVSDDGVTWYNVGVYATWLATAPVEWEADTEFAAGALVVPPVASANDHLYVVFPPGPFSSAAEPTWPTDGTYASGDIGGYAYDMGPKLGQEWSRSFPTAEFTTDPRTTEPAIRGTVADNTTPLLLANNATFRDANPDFAHTAQFQVLLREDGTVQILTDTDTLLQFDAGGPNGLLFYEDYEGDGQTQLHSIAGGRLLAEAALFALRGVSALSDGSKLSNGDWEIAASDTDFLVQKRTAGGVLKTLTIPWD